MKAARYTLFFLVSIMAQFLAIHAQWHPAIQHTNVKLGASDSIDLDTLGLQLSFPVIDKAGRGSGVHFALSYHADFWTTNSPLYPGGWYATPDYGWNFQPASPLGSYSVEEVTTQACNNPPDPSDTLYKHVYGNRVYTDALGIGHSFGGTQTYSECTDSIEQDDFSSWQTVDGYSTWEGYVYDPAGNQVAIGSGWNVDSNGNTPLWSHSASIGDCADSFVGSDVYYCDTLSKPALQVRNLNFGGGQSATSSSIVYTYRDANGNPQAVTVNFGTFTIQTNFNQGVPEFVKASQRLPVSIVYPDGTYNITYESTIGYPGAVTGRVASIQLPTGGTITYSYSNYAPSQRDGSLPYLKRTIRRTTAAGTVDDAITYNRTLSEVNSSGIPQNATVTVQPASGNAVTYGFALSEASGDVYLPISMSDGVTNKSICYTFTWNGAYTPSGGSCAQSSIGWPIVGRQTTTTLDNGLAQVASESYDANGMVTATSITDFGQPGQQQILNKTSTSYWPMNSIVNRIKEQASYDKDNHLVTDAKYTYDDYALDSVGTLVGRFPVWGTRGNRTSASVWDSGTNSYLTTYAWYDQAGQVVRTKDPSGNITSYSHDSADAFVTAVTYPLTTSQVSLGSSTGHDFNTGLVTSETDANGRTVRYGYDASLREISRTHDSASGMDGAVLSHGYPSSEYAASSNQISTKASDGQGGTADVESFSDGYGRPIRSARKTSNTVNPWIISDTCYDENGRVSIKTLPYGAATLAGSATCTQPSDTYHYDSVGRLQSVVHSDGTSISYAHMGRSVKISDEGNGSVGAVVKVLQSDGLGRIVSVCERSGTNSMAAGAQSLSPSACGTDIEPNATGFLTTYAYDPGNHTTTSNESGQTRSWIVDSLGRPLQETIPEAYSSGPSGAQGITKYTYAFNSEGLLVTRTKPRANQSDPTVLTTTTTQFDQIGRPESVTYRNNGTADDDTPDISYVYDTLSEGANQPTNAKGRLTLVQSNRGSVYYSYTSEGRINARAVSRPNGDCTYVIEQFSYDLLGNVRTKSARPSSTGGPTAANIFSLENDYDATSMPVGVLAGWAGGSLASLENSVKYQAFGVDSFNLGNGWGAQFGYDNRGRVNSFAATSSSTTMYGYTATWSGNGSLKNSADTVNGTWSYSYDEFNRIVQSSSGQPTTYQYDVWGNRYPLNNGAGGSATYTYDIHNHRTDLYGTYTYDAAGNMLSNGTKASEYDAEGRVVRVLPVNSTAVNAAYIYGPEGDRILARRGVNQTEYVYSSGSLLATYVNNQLQKVDVSGSLGHIGSYDSAGVFHYELHDWNGSTRLRTNPGGSSSTFQSGAFGETTASTSDQIQVGALDWDSDAMAAHAGARDYYPGMGIWNSPDPSGESYDPGDPQSFNRYAYVGNSPVSFVDPSGLARYEDAPLGSVFSVDGPMYDGNQNSQPKVGCQRGDDDVCDFVRRGLNWLMDHLGSAGISFGGDTPCSGMCEVKNSNPLDEETISQVLQAGGRHKTLVIGSVNVSIDYGRMHYSDGDPGLLIKATAINCSACGWAQTVDRTGVQATSNKKDGNGKGPLYGGSLGGLPVLDDAPSGGLKGHNTFSAIAVLGYVDIDKRTFQVIGAFRYSTRTDNGVLQMLIDPRIATSAELSRSLQSLDKAAIAQGWQMK